LIFETQIYFFETQKAQKFLKHKRLKSSQKGFHKSL